MKLQIREMETKKNEKIVQDQKVAKRQQIKDAKVDKVSSIIRNIKETNALGEHIKAAKMAEQAVTENPESSRIYTWWGISLGKANQNSDAITKFVKAAQLDPNNPKIYVYWGLTLAKENKFEEAIEKYRTSIELDPDNNNALGYWGAALEQLGEYDQAIVKLERAMELNNFNKLIYGVLVDSWYHKGEYSKAWQVVNRARNVKVDISDKSLKRLTEAMPEPK
jgi:Flp pilus assembly protein TadD